MTGRSWRHWRTILPVLVAVLLAIVTGCASADGGGSGDGGRSAAMATSSNELPDAPSPGSEAVQVTVARLLEDPLTWVDQPIEIDGRVFFLSRCPPPGDAGATGCVLTGFLTDPSTAVFTASDVGRGILLAEGGRALSCAEGSQPTPTCGDWTAAAVYRLTGRLARQVLGGRTTDDVQLEVSTRQAQVP